MKFDFDWPSGFGGEDICNCGRTTDDDGRTTTDAGPWVSYKLTYEPMAQVSLKGQRSYLNYHKWSIKS